MSEDPDRVVELARFPSEFKANNAASALESAGITVQVVGEYTADFQASAPGDLKLLVKEADHERAREILEGLGKS